MGRQVRGGDKRRPTVHNCSKEVKKNNMVLQPMCPLHYLIKFLGALGRRCGNFALSLWIRLIRNIPSIHLNPNPDNMVDLSLFTTWRKVFPKGRVVQCFISPVCFVSVSFDLFLQLLSPKKLDKYCDYQFFSSFFWSY